MAGQLALNGSKSHVANNINTLCAQAGVSKYDIYDIHIVI
jgi:hypothetical protein